jgi:hypothetical protein
MQFDLRSLRRLAPSRPFNHKQYYNQCTLRIAIITREEQKKQRKTKTKICLTVLHFFLQLHVLSLHSIPTWLLVACFNTSKTGASQVIEIDIDVFHFLTIVDIIIRGREFRADLCSSLTRRRFSNAFNYLLLLFLFFFYTFNCRNKNFKYIFSISKWQHFHQLFLILRL